MPPLRGPILPPIPDFLEQFAASFGVGREEATRLLGDLLLAYEPAERRPPCVSTCGFSETT